MRKRSLIYLCALLAFLIASLAVLEGTRQTVYRAHAPQMLDATARTRAAFEALKAERLKLGFPIDRADDPNETGMVGYSYSETTTTLGALDAKRSTTNPNVAAMLVDMFTELGLKAGDRVAVNFSGSFPCLNIAVLCAMDALGLDGRSIFSVGASTYGATIPEFTYGDMEHFLHAQGLISRRSTHFSMGGQADMGLEMPEDTRGEIENRLQRHGYALISMEDVAENIAARYALYGEEGAFACLVNVGGNLLSFGPDSAMHTAAGGILRPDDGGSIRGSGLVQRALQEDIPVIQLLNMKGLLPTYGLPIDPVPLPVDGEGGVFFTRQYNPFVLWPSLGIACAAVLWYALQKRKQKAGERKVP